MSLENLGKKVTYRKETSIVQFGDPQSAEIVGITVRGGYRIRLIGDGEEILVDPHEVILTPEA